MSPSQKLTGTIARKFDHTFLIAATDGHRYVGYRRALDSFGVQFDELKPGMTVSFLPAVDPRGSHDNRAVEVRVIDTDILDGI